MELPLGTVTFLLTDVEGSTAAWEEHAEAMAEALPLSLAIVEQVAAAHGGHIPVERGEGDSRLVAFDRAGNALGAAVEVQRALAGVDWPDGLQLRVRAALHAGDARLRDERTYGGLVVHRAARLRSLARGGQVLVSRAVHDLVADELPVGTELVDLGTHRLRDLSRPEQVFIVRHADLPEVEGGIRSLEAVPHNLPTQVSSFVGRVAELSAVGGLLDEHRLVTLTGPGGCGKTRLALEACADAAGKRPDGVWLVELSPLNDPGLVPDAVLAALGVAEAPGRSLVDRLTDYLAQRRVLLLLDTCEHLIDGVASLTHTLLAACPQLSLLATSREPLGITGEVTWRVPPMTVDDDGGGDGSDAVTLFIERAKAARPNFSSGGDRGATISAICRRLDGIPLAIELAAARVRALSVERILAGLDDRFRLLSGGSRTALPRQRTLQASIEWSHDALDADERAVFRRLSVFAGGFDLDGAERVAGLGDIDRDAIFDVVSRLVDKSLVQTEETPGGELRYVLLDTLRQFGFDRLIDAGEVEATRNRHLTCILELAQTARAPLHRADSNVLAALDEVIDDIRGALEWACAETGRGSQALSIVGSLAFWWTLRGRYREGQSWCERALEAAGEDADPALRRMARWALANVAFYGGDVIRAVLEAQSLADDANAAGDATLEARALAISGECLAFLDPAAGVEVLVRGVERAHASGDEWTIADTTQLLAWAYLFQSRWEDAEENLIPGRTLGRRWGHGYLLGWDGAGRAYRALHTGDFKGAVCAAEDGQRAARSVGEMSIDGTATNTKVLALLRLGRLDEAQAELRTAEDLFSRRPGLFTDLNLRSGRAFVALWQREYQQAIELFHLVVDELRSYGWTVATDPNNGLACAYRWAGDLEAATAVATEAVALARRSGSRPHEAGAILEQARVAVLRCEFKEAEELAHQALVLAAEVGAAGNLIHAIQELGCLAGAAESWEEAIRLIAATEAARAERGMVISPFDSDFVATAERATLVLGEERFTAVWTEGRALSLDETIAYARRARGERGRPSSGWDSLTPTESRVVALVVEGLTNPQIAERLFIGRGTVKTHLAHIFTKLNVSTRAELAGQASRGHLP